MKYGNCVVLGYYTASGGNFLLTFQDNLLIPSSGVKNSKESLLSQYGVYVGKSAGSEKSCQPIGLLQVVGMEGSVGVSAALEREVLW
jgi:hypothetical protein